MKYDSDVDFRGIDTATQFYIIELVKQRGLVLQLVEQDDMSN